MKVVLVVMVTFVCLAAGEQATAPPPEKPKPTREEELGEVARPERYTEKDKAFIKKLHEEIPNLHPDTFKITPTSFRKNFTPEELAQKKKEQQMKIESDKKFFDKRIQLQLDKQSEKLKSMTLEEARKIVDETEARMQSERKEESHDEL